MNKTPCVLHAFEASGYVSGNDRQTAPRPNAECKPNYSISQLQEQVPHPIAPHCTPHPNAELQPRQIAADCTTAPPLATVLATVGGAR